jgi:hypothetical protein
MNILPYAIGGLLGGTLLKSLFKKPKTPVAPKPVTQDTARDAALRNDELLRRRGGAADIVTSPWAPRARWRPARRHSDPKPQFRNGRN